MKRGVNGVSCIISINTLYLEEEEKRRKNIEIYTYIV